MATTESAPTRPASAPPGGEARLRLESIARSSSQPPGGTEPAIALGTADSPPILLREMLAVAASIAAFDLLVYRGHGYAGSAAFFVTAGLLLLAGSPHRGNRLATVIPGSMLLALAARMIWLGYGFLNFLGVVLLVAFAMTVAGRRPYVIDTAIYGLQAVVAGVVALVRYGRSASRVSPSIGSAALLKVVLPLAAVFGFGTIFILANPDVATSVGERIGRAFEWIGDGLARHRRVPALACRRGHRRGSPAADRANLGAAALRAAF